MNPEQWLSLKWNGGSTMSDRWLNQSKIIQEEEPYIDLTIRQEKIFLVIKIINQYSRDFSKNLKTTKKKQKFHGIGIRSVKSIVTKYEGEFSIDKKGTEVVVKILIPN